ncbi:potassium channel protein [Catenovulum maritimum]|uniref:Potassium channel protein n=1 Tax=Catenovulum maritimum TaxID=1513271 RepID=A0A0J8JM84_9ALTE|nr:potassium channel family protein [Catenovulum maritimum]KMT65696.1 potassium channel protein [Catenovulum maritimum]
MIFKRFLIYVQRHLNYLSWPLLSIIIALHFCLTWLGLFQAEETALTNWHVFPYYYVVTTSTVGYGDFSPSSEAGRVWVWLFQIPFGLALFGTLLGKVGQTIKHFLDRSIMGEKNYHNYHGHILLLGYSRKFSHQIVEHILADKLRESRRILLCDINQAEHPIQDRLDWVDFAKLSSFTQTDELDRIAVSTADRVIILGETDDQTFTTALKIAPLVHPNCHITAWFVDDSKIDLLQQHCPNVECTSSRVAETLVRSMQDPGASRVQEQLLSASNGDTQYCIQVPQSQETEILFESLFMAFKNQFNATVIGIARDKHATELILNPELHMTVRSGSYIHYIAKQRIRSHEIDWNRVLG